MRTIPARVALVVAFGLATLGAGCRWHAHANPAPVRNRLWILSPLAGDDDRLCVPPDRLADGLRCTTVGDVRHYVRAQRWADD